MEDEVLDEVVMGVETTEEVEVVLEVVIVIGSVEIAGEVVTAEIEREGTGGVGIGGGGAGDPIEADNDEGRFAGSPGIKVGGRDCDAGEGEDEDDELNVGDVEVMERDSPVRGHATCKGGEVVTGVAAMEVVGGRGRLEGFMPAARHCSSNEATVFFFGLETPRPRCRARS